MLALLRERNFALFWTAGLISSLGDWLLTITLPFYVYERTGSAMATSVMFMAGVVPRLLFGSLAGVFVDRWDRRRTMIAADVARAALLLLLLPAARSADWLPLVYVVEFARISVGQFFGPASGALLPRLVGKPRLTAANALNAQSGAFANLVGPTLGGALGVWLGLSGAVLLDAASFLLSALLLALVIVPPADPPPAEAAEAIAAGTPPSSGMWVRWTSVWRDWLAGMRLIWRERVLSVLFPLRAATRFSEGISGALFIVFVGQVLRGGPQEVGWFATAGGVGALLGGVLVGRYRSALRPARLIPICMAATGVIVLLMVNVPVLPVVLLLRVVNLMVAAGLGVSGQTLLQETVDDRYRGRILGSMQTTDALALLGGIGLASALGDSLGVVFLYNVVGLIWLSVGVVAAVLLPGAVGSPTEPRHRTRTAVS